MIPVDIHDTVMPDLRSLCLNRTSDSHTLWSNLPAVTRNKLTRSMTKEEILVAELQFSLVVTEVIYNRELHDLLSVVRKTIKWNDILPKFNRRHLTMVLTRLKKHSDQLCHDLERDWSTDRLIAYKPRKVYDYLDFNLDTRFAMMCVAYCDTLDELRAMMRRALAKNNDDIRIAFSPRLNAERALLPLQRLAFHRTTLRKIASELPSNSEEAMRCRLTMENITSILDRCYEVLNSLHGPGYIGDIDSLIDFGSKLSSLKERREKRRAVERPLSAGRTWVGIGRRSREERLPEARSALSSLPPPPPPRAPRTRSLDLIDLGSIGDLPLGVDHTTYHLSQGTPREVTNEERYEMSEITLDPRLLGSGTSVLQKSFEEGPLYQTYTQQDATMGDVYSYCSRLNTQYDGEHIYEEIDHKCEGDHFPRTFWCNTDVVINSGILDRLTLKEKALQESKFEIITSEVSYLKSLCILITLFYESIDIRCIITSEERESIFANILEVRKVSEGFLYDLAGALEEDIMMGGICNVVRRHAVSSFKVYIDYCSNQVRLHRTLSRLMSENEDFKDLIKSIESYQECHNYSLLSFLILPMQRITRLPLLMQAAQKRLHVSTAEYNSCRLALSALNQLVHECNEGVRRTEKFYNRENFMKENLDKLEKLKKLPRKKKNLFVRFIPTSGLGFFSL